VPPHVNYSFGSAHAGICQFAMGDASVRAFSTSTAMHILRMFATRAGEEVPPDTLPP